MACATQQPKPLQDGICGLVKNRRKHHDFFEPVHGHHLLEWNRGVLKYLALPPGWRFLVAGDYEDVWFDVKLLEV